MFKNVASQKITLLAIDTASNVPKTGDSANITAYVSKDDGAVTVLGDTTATELDATNAPGLYSFDLTQAETNADKLVFSAKSSTSGVKIVPVLIYTFPTTGILAPTVSGRTLDVSAGGEAGIDWANVGSPTTIVNLSGTTISTSQAVASVSGSVGSISGVTFPSNFAALVITVGGAITAGTVSDKTGYSISGTTTTLDALQTALNSAHGSGSWSTATGFSTHSAADVWAVGTRTITGGTITTYTGNTPQTGDAYAIVNSGTYGNAALKTLVDDLPTNAELSTALAGADDAVLAAIAALSIPTVAEIADGVWDESMDDHTTSGTYGGRIVRATNSDVEVQITGAHHIAADVHEFQAGVITSGDFGTDAIAAACVSAGAANKIADHVRRRQQANVEASSDGDTLSLLSLYGFIQQAQESSASGGTLTVKKTDGTTTLGTRTLASSASADPITGVS